MCINVCVCINIHVCVRINIHVCLYINIHACDVHVWVFQCTYIYILVYMCVFVYLFQIDHKFGEFYGIYNYTCC